MKTDFMGGSLSFKGDKKAKKKKRKSKHKKESQPPPPTLPPDDEDEDLTPAEKKALKRKREREKEELEKVPGIAETLDFAAALMGLGIGDLTENPAALQATLTTLLKTQSDRAHITTEVAQRIAGKAA